MKSVYSAVRTGALNKAVCASSLKGKYSGAAVSLTSQSTRFVSLSYSRKLRTLNYVGGGAESEESGV